MPVSKNTLARYQVINTCFLSRNKKYWSQAELLQKLEACDILISSRTLRADIEAMRCDDRLGYHAPIEYCALNRGYHYSDPEYSINKICLSHDEQDTLLAAITMLRPYAGIQVLSDFKTIVAKVINHINSTVDVHKSVPEIENIGCIPPGIGEHINTIMDAIRTGVVLQIVVKDTCPYMPDQDLLHPYMLSTDQVHWYITGLHDAYRTFTFYRLDWIAYIVRTDKKFVPHAEILVTVQPSLQCQPDTTKSDQQVIGGNTMAGAVNAK